MKQSLSAILFAVGLVLTPSWACAEDAVLQLNDFINQHISSEPQKVGKVGLSVEKDEQGNMTKLVDLLHPFSKLRPIPRARAQELNWASDEDVMIRIDITKTPAEWRYRICRPDQDTSSC